MSKYCNFIVDKFYDENEVSKEMKQEILEGINNLREMYDSSPELYKDQVGKFIQSVNIKNAQLAEIDINHLIVEDAIIQDLKSASDLGQKIQSMFFINREISPGSGLSIETTRKVNVDRFINSFHASLAKENVFEAARSGAYDRDVYKAIATNSIELLDDPVAKTFAKTLKHFQDVIHAAYNDAYVPVAYRKDFVINRVLSREKVSSVGFNEFSADLIKSLNVGKSYGGLNVAATKEVIDTLMNGGNIEDLLGTNALADDLWKTYSRHLDDFDPFKQEETGWFTKEFNAKEAISKTRVKSRKWVFASPDAEYDFLMKYSPYDSLVEAYMGGAQRASREISIFNKLGPQPKKTIESMQKYINSTDLPNGEKASLLNKVNSMMHMSQYGVSKSSSTFGKLLDNVVLPLQSSALLGRALFANLQDMPTQFIHQMVKGDDGLIGAAVKVSANRLKATMDALGEDGVKYMLSAEDARNMAFNNAITDLSSTPAKMADLVSKLSLTKFFNKTTWIASFHSGLDILIDSAKKGKLSEAQTRLFKQFNMGVEDLVFLKDHLKTMETPNELYYLPLEAFENNPAGVSAKAYKASIVKKIHSFMYEYVSRSSSTPGMLQRYYSAFGNANPDSFQALAGKMTMQFRSVALKQFFENVHAVSLSTGSTQYGRMLKDKKAVSNAALFLTFGMGSLLIADSLKRLSMGETPEDIIASYEDNKGKAFTTLVLRSNMMSFYGDLAYNAKSSREVLSSLATPSLNAMFSVGMVPKDIVEGNPRAAAREVVNTAQSLTPMQNLIWIGPLSKDIKEAKEKMIDNLSDLF